MHNIDSHLFPLEGTRNTRDLGGYETMNGGITKPFVFVRSDNTAGLTNADIQFLMNHGLTLAVDLRSNSEITQSPSPLAQKPGILYKNVPMLDNIHSASFAAEMPSSMSGLYQALLDQSPETFAEVFHCLAACEGLALFNCTAGKDRTGLTSMLLLLIAGVAEDIIIADYAATEVYLQDIAAAQKQSMKEKGILIPDFLLRSAPETMEDTLAHLRKSYGSAEMYLLSCGISAAEVLAIKERFLTPAD